MRIAKLLATLMSVLALGLAGGTAYAANAAPLGFELGVAKFNEVQSVLSPQTKVSDAGLNKYTEGKMLVAAPAGLGIEGLREINFIFDKSDVLSGVVMTMQKDPKGLVRMLSKKYKLVSNKIDNFMNYGSARFEKGDSIIEINAPHLSSNMHVMYVTKSLNAAFNKASNDEESSKKKRKADSL